MTQIDIVESQERIKSRDKTIALLKKQLLDNDCVELGNTNGLIYKKSRRDKEIPELNQCSECNNEILTRLPKKECSHHRIIFTIQNSQSSQSSGISTLSNLMNESFILTSPTIQFDTVAKRNLFKRSL
uniref:Uncharacterized protein n=1 Tax=Rhizophagus irregularis (strain DAOM 181602 / DAOM 197198 / MUCL 43194) TaxID=747089 RepID=U9U7M4_RHIID